ncbi:SMI1/KNR4 family protein [Pseudomonas shirazica]|nr:SMI1/KNR4 family protein [Pseudomonas shirazica]
MSDRPYLMYAYSEGGDLCFYMGGAPLGVEGSGFDGCPSFPASFRQFYSRLHNGFGFYIGCTMGPSRLEDFVAVKELCDEDYPALPDMVAVFSSGAGDYLALGNGSHKGQAFIWWHEKQENPTEGIELWDVMDSWMSIFWGTPALTNNKVEKVGKVMNAGGEKVYRGNSRLTIEQCLSLQLSWRGWGFSFSPYETPSRTWCPIVAVEINDSGA